MLDKYRSIPKDTKQFNLYYLKKGTVSIIKPVFIENEIVYSNYNEYLHLPCSYKIIKVSENTITYNNKKYNYNSVYLKEINN